LTLRSYFCSWFQLLVTGRVSGIGLATHDTSVAMKHREAIGQT
jgi:hypothetical protein